MYEWVSSLVRKDVVLRQTYQTSKTLNNQCFALFRLQNFVLNFAFSQSISLFPIRSRLHHLVHLSSLFPACHSFVRDSCPGRSNQVPLRFFFPFLVTSICPVCLVTIVGFSPVRLAYMLFVYTAHVKTIFPVLCMHAARMREFRTSLVHTPYHVLHRRRQLCLLLSPRRVAANSVFSRRIRLLAHSFGLLLITYTPGPSGPQAQKMRPHNLLQTT